MDSQCLDIEELLRKKQASFERIQAVEAEALSKRPRLVGKVLYGAVADGRVSLLSAKADIATKRIAT